MSGIVFLFVDLIDIYVWIVIAGAVLSWLISFNVVDPRNQIVGSIGNFLHRVTEPALAPIRRLMPDLGGIDLSPVVLIFGLFLLQRVILAIFL
ncbi:Cell division integral membrane protein, YggT and half-length relatives [hydrothermal vent metagenome]|uniref:Cell division integral membrane protein, YggT and half-length relatives n=1 Tax=hydrothermal vent metagenome TaxID=652676 RepID=A0A3B0T4F3_9ZZZZ